MQTSSFHNFNRIDKRGKKKSIHNIDGIIISNMNLPSEILTEILRRLPVKSLIRFKCVNKSWCAFINSPEFIALHLSHVNRNNTKQYLLLLIERFIEDVNKNFLSLRSNNESLSITAADLELPSLFLPHIEVMGPANGVVCISDRTNTFLCNPALRKFRKLPPCPFGLRQGFCRGSPRSGFGYDPVTNEYKYIRLATIEEEKNFRADNVIVKAEIYNISANSWREFKLELVPKILSHCSFKAVPFKGSIHWSIRDRILAFNICTEVFGEIGYPTSVHIDWERRENNLTVLGESLTLISGITKPLTLTLTRPLPQEESDEYNSIEVWVMKEYGVGESWTKMFHIEPIPGAYHLLFFWNNDQDLLTQTWERQLISCDPYRGQEFRKYQVNGLSRGPVRILAYSETLIDPNSIVSTAPLTVITYKGSVSSIDAKNIVNINNDD